MTPEVADIFTVNGRALRQRIVAGVTDSQAYRVAARAPEKYRLLGDNARPNMFKARDDAVGDRMKRCHSSDPWVRELITQWVNMSGLQPADADFWQAPSFMEAVREGRDLQIRRYLDDDGWAWIVVRDVPTQWTHRRRLPEAVRQKMVAQKERQKGRTWR